MVTAKERNKQKCEESRNTPQDMVLSRYMAPHEPVDISDARRPGRQVIHIDTVRPVPRRWIVDGARSGPISRGILALPEAYE